MPHGDPTKPLTIRLEKARWAAYEAAAERAEMTLSEWARKHLDAASGAPPRPEKKQLRKDAALERIIELARKARG